MSNFNDYISSNKSNKKDIRKDVDKKTLEEKIEQYQKLSGSDLMHEFIKLTLEKKKNGELGKSEIESIRQTIYPHLSNEQKMALNNLLNMVEDV